MPWIYLVSAVIGYLLGSFPTGYLVGRRHGIDIREHGSGNIGATNVVRVLGKKVGYLVFFCDAAKGLLAVYSGELLFVTRSPASELSCIIAGLACILGHNFPVWLRFRGGKGVATTIGVLLGLMPVAVAIAAGVWLITFLVMRYVSLASMLAAASLPIIVWRLTGPDTPMFWFSVVAAVLIFVRHRANISRLFHGTEPQFTRKKEEP